MAKRKRRPDYRAPGQAKTVQLEAPHPDEQPLVDVAGLDPFDPLTSVISTHAEVVDATERRTWAIGVARRSGVTWAQLAAVLEVTPQAVQKRYGGSPTSTTERQQ